MAVTFLEPGMDATFTNSLWSNPGVNVTSASDIVHGNHVRSRKYGTGAGNFDRQNNALNSGATGGRISFYAYIDVLPGGTATIATLATSGNATIAALRLTSGGVLQMWSNTAQIGSDGATISAGGWHRFCVAMTASSTSVNRFEVFLDAASTISITNATLGQFNPSLGTLHVGNETADGSMIFHASDYYVDNATSLVDTGDIWVTAKLPVANGTTNDFSTQIGSGGSGYGTGHAPQVNERALNLTNGWSMTGVGSVVTEEYTIEAASVGDIDISAATIKEVMGWVFASSATSETGSIIVKGSASNISLTSTSKMFTKIAGSTVYPAGNTDIGIKTSTTVTTVSLYECGIIVAFIPAAPTIGSAGTYYQRRRRGAR